VDTLKDLEDILKLPGLDVLFVGPSDLAQSLGYPGEPGHPEVTKVADEVVARAKAAGVKTGTVAYTPQVLESVIARGFDMIVASANTFLAASALAYMGTAKIAVTGA
jgi:2-keto-3-deoxy-L-rhamnonate aldolase RhmA